MDLKYIESEIGRRKLKEVKRTDLLYAIITILIAIIFVILLLDTKNIKGVIVFLIIFTVIVQIIKSIKKKLISKVMVETLTQEICLDGCINLHIYNIQKAKKGTKTQKVYNYSLLNIIDAYIRKGDFEQADNVINFLEKREIDDIVKAFLIQYKASSAYYLNNIEEFKRQSDAFGKISNLIPAQIKNQISTSLELNKYIIENNVDKVNAICNQLENGKTLLNKVVASYYRGVILEKNNNEEYKKYYKFVVENGNDLNIAKIAGEKLGEKTQVKYKEKKHIGFKILTSLLLAILVFITVFVSDFYYEMTKTKWETGVVYISDEKINLPCTISEIEKNLNVEIDTKKINAYGFYKLYLNQDYLDVGDITLSSGKYIELYIDGDTVTGIKIDISNSWNDELDTELGDMAVFPENITANSTTEEIQAAYRTGIINPAMSEWSEEIVDKTTNDIIYNGGLKYSGNKYDISIDFTNGKVESIFYYYN